jgi:hypothetical protein
MGSWVVVFGPRLNSVRFRLAAILGRLLFWGCDDRALRRSQSQGCMPDRRRDRKLAETKSDIEVVRRDSP